MYAEEQEFDLKPYRPQMNPAFVRRVQEKRRAENKTVQSLEMQLAAALKHLGQLKMEVSILRASASAEVREEADEAMDRVRFRHTFALIEKRAARLFHVNKEEIRGAGKTGMVVLARQFIYYWCKRLTRLSSPQIGRLMGGRDHSTVLHGLMAYQVKRRRMNRVLRRV